MNRSPEANKTEAGDAIRLGKELFLNNQVDRAYEWLTKAILLLQNTSFDGAPPRQDDVYALVLNLGRVLRAKSRIKDSKVMMKAALDLSTLRITPEQALACAEQTLFETNTVTTIGVAMSPEPKAPSKVQSHHRHQAQHLPEGGFRNFASNTSSGSVSRYLGVFGV